ncbi:MAG TPA: hypothetical protein PLQ13_03580 [Candidatus Krumholzibacteria bacterium]|nr:hypothetical protein [Candidatus Krumholzibacteria bacterium]
MRARRVMIMLLLAAISALTLFVVVLFGGAAEAAECPASAVPDTLASCRDHLDVAASGDAIASVTVVLGRVSSMDLLLPCSCGDGRGHVITKGPAAFGADASGAPLPIVEVLGRPHWNLRLLAGAAPGDTIVAEAVVPGWYDADATRREFGVHALGRSWVNSTPAVVRRMELGLSLPPGLLVERVGATTPGFNANRSPEPPYRILREGDRDVFVITTTDLEPSGRSAFALEARPGRRGPMALAVGVLLAALYLLSFRDVLKPEPGR